MSWVRRAFFLVGVFVTYVLFALVVDLSLPTRPVLATCVFDVAVAWVFRPRGFVIRASDVDVPSARVPVSRLCGMGALWLPFWFGTQVTVTVLALAGVSTGVYSDIRSEEYMFYLVLTVLLAPLAEEFFFRAFLFGHLRRMVPFWTAAAIQAVVFAWAHGSGVHWYVGVVCGFAFAFLYLWTGDVRVSAGFHCAYNALCVVGAMVPVPSGIVRQEFVWSFNALVLTLTVLAGCRLRERLSGREL